MPGEHRRADGVDRGLWVGAAGSRGALGDDDQPGGHRERRHITPSDQRRRFGDRGLDVLGIVVPAVDGHQVRHPAGDIQLAVEVDGQVTGPQPVAVDLCAGGVAAFAEGRTQLGAEREPRLLGPPPITAPDVVALQPRFADATVGQLGTGFRVHDHRPQAACHLAAGHLADGIGRIGGNLDEPVVGECSAVDVNHLRRLIHRGGRDE